VIAGLKPYPRMKDSGVPWLGEVPEHWQVSPIARIGQLFKGNGGSKEDEVAEGVPCIRYGDLYTRHEFFVRSAKACVSTERASAYTAIFPGDLLFAASGETIEDIGRSAVNLIEGHACCGGDVLLLRPSVPTNSRFLGYAADAPPVRNQKATMGRGFTVVHIYASQLKRLTLAFPPLPEQAAIVRFLDHADRRIRRYIRAKQKLIKLLEEQKQAIIHRAVTRGLDPSVRLKPSGVEWLGDVPEHWEVGRLSQFFALQRGFDITKDQQRPGSIPVVSSGGVSSFHDTATAKGPGVLVGRKGTAGSVHYIDADYWAHDTSLWVYDFKGNSPRFVYHLLRTLDLKRFDTGSANPTLNRNLIHPERVAFPPQSEQPRITLHLDRDLSRLDDVSGATQREVDLLREYRIRLVADVVTGKLDVREAAERLPDEGEEPEPLLEMESEVDTDEAGSDGADELSQVA